MEESASIAYQGRVIDGPLERGRELGSGGFGVVYYGVYKGHEVAIKTLKSLAPNQVAQFEQEVQVMERLNHPRVVQFYGAMRADDYSLVIEYMPGGPLDELLRSSKRIAKKQIYQIGVDIASGIAYLHKNGVTHNDLKSPNVLLDNWWRAKVCDFGFSKIRTENSTYGSCNSFSWPWSAPELLSSNNPRNSKEADVYSFGVLLWELGARLPPMKGLSIVEIAQRAVKEERDPISEGTPPPMKELIKRCWSLAPNERPTIDEALKYLEDNAPEPLVLTETPSVAIGPLPGKKAPTQGSYNLKSGVFNGEKVEKEGERQDLLKRMEGLSFTSLSFKGWKQLTGQLLLPLLETSPGLTRLD